MTEEGYLPIGTVVLLKGAEKEIMIIGYGIVPENSNEVYDYLACFYPEGVISPDINLTFNKDEIDKILFLGHKSDNWEDFRTKLGKSFSKIREDIDKS